MGMFDSIVCEMPLPGWEGKPPLLQTKSLSCECGRYLIRTDGRLVREFRKHEETADNPRLVKKVHVGHHGILRMYTCVGDINTDDWKWWEWEAKFTDGVCVEITRKGR